MPLALVGTLLLHVRVESRDGAWLLSVDGRALDLRGALADPLNRLGRDCSGVATLQRADPDWSAALAQVRDHSPPDSRSAELVTLQRSGDWLVAEIAFGTLEPAVLVLQRQGARWQIADAAIWSGTTAPWRPGPFIRQFVGARVPGLPPALLACLSPSGFDAPGAGLSAPTAAPTR